MTFAMFDFHSALGLSMSHLFGVHVKVGPFFMAKHTHLFVAVRSGRQSQPTHALSMLYCALANERTGTVQLQDLSARGSSSEACEPELK